MHAMRRRACMLPAQPMHPLVGHAPPGPPPLPTRHESSIHHARAQYSTHSSACAAACVRHPPAALRRAYILDSRGRQVGSYPCGGCHGSAAYEKPVRERFHSSCTNTYKHALCVRAWAPYVPRLFGHGTSLAPRTCHSGPTHPPTHPPMQCTRTAIPIPPHLLLLHAVPITYQ